MTTYQILFLIALYAALQGMAYLEHSSNRKTIPIARDYGWIMAARFVNLFVVSVGLIAVFFYLGA